MPPSHGCYRSVPFIEDHGFYSFYLGMVYYYVTKLETVKQIIDQYFELKVN